MSVSARFGFPLLSAGQAQKEVSHNEALTLIDTLVQSCVESIGNNVPPADPVPGQSWIVGTSPEDEWDGEADSLALWTSGGWRFVAPREGMAVWVAQESLCARHTGGAWQLGITPVASVMIDGEQVVGGRETAIEDPDGGGVTDIEARVAITAILDALRSHGLIDTA
ncbi:DUF2793 domain-containing protein [Sphingomonas sp. LT1P40]|uniref:DUF2793 domain-containing protein n=1 Tax=Alteristakelama amylovorans TaxID=3096166 RepID=UPI002FCA2EDE